MSGITKELDVFKTTVARVHPGDGESMFEIAIQEPDPYTGLYGVEFRHQLWDEYNKKWLDARVMKLFLRKDQLEGLGTGILYHFR